MAQKGPSRSMKDRISINIAEFNKAYRTLFESLYQMSQVQQTTTSAAAAAGPTTSGATGVQTGAQTNAAAATAPMPSPVNNPVYNNQSPSQGPTTAATPPPPTQTQLQQQLQMQQMLPLQNMSLLKEADKSLQQSLKQLEQHQLYQKEIVAIQREIEEHDQIISNLASKLKEAELLLENEISDASRGDDIKEREVYPEELISYAHKISGTTSAPYGYQTHLPLIPLYKPPAPQEEMMRMSMMFARLPLQLLRFYGLAEKDLALASPIALGQRTPTAGDQLDTAMDTNTDSQADDESAKLLQQQQLQQQQQQLLLQQQQQDKLLVPPSNLTMPTQPNKQGQQGFASLDLDLNPELEDEDESSEEDDGDSSENEPEWE
ncbi:hypothetical protein SAMD00019534_021890, partial [Acytostelium subglobosum LB1]|uniref:hypothetical protein n=1 Tax=Acytostelium subglobosum LB1 TaxID=1410327 RepID=UPI000644C966